MSHYDTCSANLCQEWEGESLTWYPDEDICTLKPYEHYQKIQRRIQKLYLAGKIDAETYYTRAELEDKQSVRVGITGHNPNMPRDNAPFDEPRMVGRRRNANV